MVTSGLQRRLLESHLVIAFAGLLFVGVLFASATFLNRSAQKISDSVGPVPRAVLSLINALQSSVAANHGWVYVGDEKFLDQNQQAWQDVDQTFALLREARAQSADLLDQPMLDDLQARIEQLRELQSGIQFKSQGIDSDARGAMLYHVQPLADHLSRRIARYGEDPDWLAFPDLARALAVFDKQLGETRMALTLTVGSRNESATTEFATAREALSQTLASAAFQAEHYPVPINRRLSDLNLVGQAYLAAADNALMLYEASANRTVREFLFERAVPLTNSIIATLQSLEEEAAREVERRRDEMSEVTAFSLVSSVLAFGGLVVAAVIISLTNSSRLLKRLQRLSSALEGFTGDGRTDLLQVRGDDEIASLTRMFNRMVLKLEEKQQALRRHQSELEQRVSERTRELHRAKEFAETTLSSIADALMSVDKKGRIAMANPAAGRLLGQAPEALIGQSAGDLLWFHQFDDKGKGVPVYPIQDCQRTQAVLMPDEYLLLETTAGQTIPVKLSAAPIPGERDTVDGVILILRDVTREMEMQRELSHRANHDSLTGLANRARFNGELDRLLAVKPDSRGRNVVAFFDLDRFKEVNDTGGHAAGDALLRQLAGLLRDNLRPADLPARLGGDEFAVLFRHCTIEQAERAAARLRDKIAQHQMHRDGQEFSVGVSIGVTEILAGDANLSEVLSIADEACYEAKSAGRNAVMVAARHRQSATVTPLRSRQGDGAA